MKVFPQYDGAMVDWPVVAAVDGAPETLARLSQNHRLMVGTNAANSSAEQVRAALNRAGIGQYIERVLTYHELGSRKPAPEFFRAIQQQAGAAGLEMVMIGDEYKADISGAWQAGWKTVWFNPGRYAAPGLCPLQTTEITEFSALPDALTRLSLPDVHACLAWMAQEGTAASLIAHVQAVAATAYQMAIWMRAAGHEVDVVLAHRGGLLHDLAKLSPHPASQPRMDHGERAAQMLERRQQPVLAEIARRHMMDSLIDANRQPETPEQQLVYFADKIVEGSSVVDFEERLAALHLRYPAYSDGFRQVAPAVIELRERLCAQMGISASDLTRRLRQAFFNQ